MDPAHVARLKEEQERSLDETLANVKKWETFDYDYSALQDRLRTLPDKVSYNIMVPFGQVAFMPGQIVHTNEIMVLLGDNWFAERSAKQACEIIDRRKEHLQTMLSDLAKQRHLLESRLGFTSELKDMSENKGDLVDIREEYDPEKEAKWREERKKKKREATYISERSKPPGDSHSSLQKTPQKTPADQRQAPSENSRILQNQPQSEGLNPMGTGPQVDGSEGTRRNKEESETAEDGVGVVKGRMTEEELWARLDDLERQEEELDELALMSEEEMEPNDDSVKPQPDVGKEGRHIRWQDERMSDNADNGEESDLQAKPTTITFKHTQQAGANAKASNESSSSTTPTEIPTAIRSPADIYKQYVSSAHSPEGGSDDETARHQNLPLKSILKGGSNSHPVKAAEGIDGMHRREEKSHVILPAPPSAFSGQVTERPDAAANRDTAAIELPSSNTETTTPPKRVSRFKAARQQQR